MNNQVILPWPKGDMMIYQELCAALAKKANLTLPRAKNVSIAEVLGGAMPRPEYHLWADFFPPNRRAVDEDRIFKMFDAGISGVSLALGIDDKYFISHPFLKNEIGGMVKVRLTGGPND